jgi:hypothetical protein
VVSAAADAAEADTPVAEELLSSLTLNLQSRQAGHASSE